MPYSRVPYSRGDQRWACPECKSEDGIWIAGEQRNVEQGQCPVMEFESDGSFMEADSCEFEADYTLDDCFEPDSSEMCCRDCSATFYEAIDLNAEEEIVIGPEQVAAAVEVLRSTAPPSDPLAALAAEQAVEAPSGGWKEAVGA